MNKINRKLEYALMALKLMSVKAPGELTTAKEIVDQTGCPFDATARVLQTMAHRGLLKSEQGAYGGYTIIKDLAKVSMYELMEMILGPLGVVKCLHGEESCDLITNCNIMGPIGALNRRLGEFYKSLTVAELLKVKEPYGREKTSNVEPALVQQEA